MMLRYTLLFHNDVRPQQCFKQTYQPDMFHDDLGSQQCFKQAYEPNMFIQWAIIF
jgi:hypothetical protein